jgi:hypothetical protein
MESQSRDLALPLIRGEAITLDFNQQVQVASWCFLKAITLELGRPSGDYPNTYEPEVYQGFRQHLVPPLSCLITVGRREIVSDVFVWFKSQRETHHTGPPAGDIDGYRTALVIRHLAIEVFGVYRVPANVKGDDDARWLQIWPPSNEPLDWPPTGNFRLVDDALV